MKKIAKLKLSQLNKDSMNSRQKSQIMGGYFCYWGFDNLEANEREGKCSCPCWSGVDYYDTTYGIKGNAEYCKNW